MCVSYAASRPPLSCFHGRLSSEAAARLLGKRAGHFVVRLSSQAGSYAVSVCRRDGSVAHYRVEIGAARTEARVCVGEAAESEEARALGARRFGSVREALVAARRVLRMKHPVEGSGLGAVVEMVVPGLVAAYRDKYGDLLGLGQASHSDTT